MRKSILRASSALQAIALVGAGSAGVFIAAPAAAQDYTSGAIIGNVTNSIGRPVAGATVTMRSLAQNQVRTFVTDSTGTFTASGLPAGDYALTVRAAGYQPSENTITITAAQESKVTVGLVSTTTSSEIVVTGHLRQVQTQGTTGLNVNVVAVNANAPIGHDITSLTLLAPSAEKGVTAFSHNGEAVPSIGGSSVAENAYYINGLNITNPDTYVGSARVPFYFYQNVDVQTGGYPAEFGRATGAVINATTKQGTNIPFLAAHFDWEPDWLESHSPNLGTGPAGPYDIGRMNKADHKQLTLEGGGAIIPDHLFVYGLIEPQRNTTERASARDGLFERSKNNDPFWGAKIDAYINPTQHAEFTIFDTRATTTYYDYLFTPNANCLTAPVGTIDTACSGGTIGALKNGGIENVKSGGLNWVARYTGDVTNWLTLSGAYGLSKDSGDVIPESTTNYFAQNCRSGTCSIVSQDQPFLTHSTDETSRRFYRADADIRFAALGTHHIRLGFDNEDLSELKTQDINGTLPIRYRYYNGFAYLLYEHLGGHVSGNDTAYYIEDSWTGLVNGLTLNIGLRDDEFRQTNLSGQQYLNQRGNWGPRVAFTYTPPAMDKWKFFGSYGRYFIPPAMNLGFRGKDLYFGEAFDYAGGWDPVTGLPTSPLGAAIPGFAGYSDCPVNISSAPGNPVNAPGACAVYGGGIQNPAIAKVVPGTKATYEDEFILGTRYQATPLLSVGLTGTYRKLGRVSEDTDFAPQLAAYWCASAHYDANRCNFYQNNSSYYIWNVSPVTSLTVNDWVAAMNGQKLPVTLTTGMHFPKVKRTYESVVLDFNRADDGVWTAHGSVTWSKLKGNTEGTVKSDAGNGAQTDAGSTEDFDYLGLGDYSNGLLPNDHRWMFKLYGAYHFGKVATIGANIFVQSPMHGSCLGYHPFFPQPDVFDPSAFYGSVSHFCGTGPLNARGYYTQTSPAPRGTGWTSDWMKQIDLSFRYNIPLGPTDSRKIVLRADVFNVFNSHAVIQKNAQHEISRGTGSRCVGATYNECWKPNPDYLTPLYYQQPRYVRIGMDVYWGGSVPVPPPPPVVAPPPPPPAAPATQTCPDGTVILATATCPVPPPPPPPVKPERG